MLGKDKNAVVQKLSTPALKIFSKLNLVEYREYVYYLAVNSFDVVAKFFTEVRFIEHCIESVRAVGAMFRIVAADVMDRS